MLKSTVTAIIIAVFLFFTSAYIALKMGALPWPIIFSIIVSVGFLKGMRQLSSHHVNIAQAGGSIGGLMAAAVVFTLPGLLIESPNYFPPAAIASVGLLGALLGIGLSIPLREEYVIKKNLPYPAGKAGGEIIKTGFNKDRRFGLMLISGLIAALFTLIRESLGWNFIPIHLGQTQLLILIMPMVIATGVILGSESSFSWASGGFLSVVSGMIFMVFFGLKEPIPLLQNFGMGLVIGSGIGYILIHVGSSVNLRSFISNQKKWVWIINGISFLFMLWMGLHMLSIVLCLLLAFFSVNIASRMTGQTNIDPLEQFGLLSALLITFFLGMAKMELPLEHRYLITFFIATATAVAGDIGHDYKSAQIVGTDHSKIVYVDLITACVVSITIPLLIFILQDPVILDKLFTFDFPAPQAQIVHDNLQGLPHPVVFILGLVLAFVLEFVRFKNKLTFLHLMPFGIGLFLGFNLAFLIGIGGLIAFKIQKKGTDKTLTAIVVSAAILGGEGTIGFLRSAVTVFVPQNGTMIMGITSLILIAFLARYIRLYFSIK